MNATATKNRTAVKTNSQKDDRFITKILENLDKVNANDWEKYTNIKFHFPRNLFTKKEYRGFNILALNIDTMVNGFTSSYYATFNTISKAGGKLKKGARGTVIEFFSFIYRDKESNKIIPLEQVKKMTLPELEQLNKFPCIRTYVVFNSEWIENFSELNLEIEVNEEEELDFQDQENCENFINKIIVNGNLQLKTGKQSAAYYSPARDYIFVPEKKYFINESKYYGTFFHEVIHWTGHETRLKRKLAGHNNINSYSFEELIAEMGSMLVCLQFGIFEEFINSVRYLKGWSKANEEDRVSNIKKAFIESKKAKKYLENL